VFYTWLNTKVQPLLLAGEEDGLARLHFSSGSKATQPDPDWIENAQPFKEATRQLEAYFAGELRSFTIPLCPHGTDFQLRVWEELRRIPFGQTISYLQLAERIGNARAVRAVGLANGANPLGIIVPCHRVIGSNGSLTGFGGGIDLKRYLLRLEGALPETPSLFDQ
jgi:methylated-DNA-[protein]-cysteine S-methyltransferase